MKKNLNRWVFQNVFDLMFDLNTSGNPCLRLMVTEAELLMLGIRPAMLHIFIWDTILGC